MSRRASRVPPIPRHQQTLDPSKTNLISSEVSRGQTSCFGVPRCLTRSVRHLPRDRISGRECERHAISFPSLCRRLALQPDLDGNLGLDLSSLACRADRAGNNGLWLGGGLRGCGGKRRCGLHRRNSRFRGGRRGGGQCDGGRYFCVHHVPEPEPLPASQEPASWMRQPGSANPSRLSLGACPPSAASAASAASSLACSTAAIFGSFLATLAICSGVGIGSWQSFKRWSRLAADDLPAIVELRRHGVDRRRGEQAPSMPAT